jgi:hypothetical protein
MASGAHTSTVCGAAIAYHSRPSRTPNQRGHRRFPSYRTTGQVSPRREQDRWLRRAALPRQQSGRWTWPSRVQLALGVSFLARDACVLLGPVRQGQAPRLSVSALMERTNMRSYATVRRSAAAQERHTFRDSPRAFVGHVNAILRAPLGGQGIGAYERVRRTAGTSSLADGCECRQEVRASAERACPSSAGL